MATIPNGRLLTRPLHFACSLPFSSMQWLRAAGRCTLKTRHSFEDVLVHLPRFAAQRNMSSSEAKRPVSLLGTMAFGGRADAEQSLAMVKTFLDRGHRHVDTAFMYMDGRSEAVIGGMNLPTTGISQTPVRVATKHAGFTVCCCQLLIIHIPAATAAACQQPGTNTVHPPIPRVRLHIISSTHFSGAPAETEPSTFNYWSLSVKVWLYWLKYRTFSIPYDANTVCPNCAVCLFSNMSVNNLTLTKANMSVTN